MSTASGDIQRPETDGRLSRAVSHGMKPQDHSGTLLRENSSDLQETSPSVIALRLPHRVRVAARSKKGFSGRPVSTRPGNIDRAATQPPNDVWEAAEDGRLDSWRCQTEDDEAWRHHHATSCSTMPWQMSDDSKPAWRWRLAKSPNPGKLSPWLQEAGHRVKQALHVSAATGMHPPRADTVLETSPRHPYGTRRVSSLPKVFPRSRMSMSSTALAASPREIDQGSGVGACGLSKARKNKAAFSLRTAAQDSHRSPRRKELSSSRQQAGGDGQGQVAISDGGPPPMLLAARLRERGLRKHASSPQASRDSTVREAPERLSTKQESDSPQPPLPPPPNPPCLRQAVHIQIPGDDEASFHSSPLHNSRTSGPLSVESAAQQGGVVSRDDQGLPALHSPAHVVTFRSPLKVANAVAKTASSPAERALCVQRLLRGSSSNCSIGTFRSVSLGNKKGPVTNRHVASPLALGPHFEVPPVVCRGSMPLPPATKGVGECAMLSMRTEAMNKSRRTRARRQIPCLTAFSGRWTADEDPLGSIAVLDSVGADESESKGEEGRPTPGLRKALSETASLGTPLSHSDGEVAVPRSLSEEGSASGSHRSADVGPLAAATVEVGTAEALLWGIVAEEDSAKASKLSMAAEEEADSAKSGATLKGGAQASTEGDGQSQQAAGGNLDAVGPLKPEMGLRERRNLPVLGQVRRGRRSQFVKVLTSPTVPLSAGSSNGRGCALLSSITDLGSVSLGTLDLTLTGAGSGKTGSMPKEGSVGASGRGLLPDGTKTPFSGAEALKDAIEGEKSGAASGQLWEESGSCSALAEEAMGAPLAALEVPAQPKQLKRIQSFQYRRPASSRAEEFSGLLFDGAESNPSSGVSGGSGRLQSGKNSSAAERPRLRERSTAPPAKKKQLRKFQSMPQTSAVRTSLQGSALPLQTLKSLAKDAASVTQIHGGAPKEEASLGPEPNTMPSHVAATAVEGISATDTAVDGVASEGAAVTGIAVGFTAVEASRARLSAAAEALAAAVRELADAVQRDRAGTADTCAPGTCRQALEPKCLTTGARCKGCSVPGMVTSALAIAASAADLASVAQEHSSPDQISSARCVGERVGRIRC